WPEEIDGGRTFFAELVWIDDDFFGSEIVGGLESDEERLFGGRLFFESEKVFAGEVDCVVAAGGGEVKLAQLFGSLGALGNGVEDGAAVRLLARGPGFDGGFGAASGPGVLAGVGGPLETAGAGWLAVVGRGGL